MANPATIPDIEDRWRPLSDQEKVNADAFLGDAWGEILSRRPSIEADITAGTVSTANVIRVVTAMVLRILRNPGGYESESVDDWTGRRSRLVADGILRVTPDELALISPGRVTRRSVRLVVYGDA